MPVRTAIIGAGKVGKTHAEVLDSLPDAEFVAVCSRSRDKAEAIATAHGVAAFTDVGTMIDRAGVEAVIICTPHPAHAEPAIAAMTHGAHALIEKPMAASLADCDAMLAAAQEHGVKLSVISQRRWTNAAQRVKAAIDSGKIGTPVLGMVMLLGWRDQAYYESDPWRGRWDAEGGGVLVNQAPHQLDLLLWYMGEIDQLSGYWINANHPYIEVEDTAVAVIRFKNGALGNIVVSNSQKPGLYGKVHVHGQTGASVGVQTDGGSMFIAGMTTVAEPPVNDIWTIPGQEVLLEGWRQEEQALFERIDPIHHYFALQVQDFLTAILEDRPPLVTGHDGRRVVELFTGLYKSNRSGGTIQFPLIPG